MNARHALGLLLRASHTRGEALTDAQVLVDVVGELRENEYELVCLLAVLTRLAAHAVCGLAGIGLGELNVDGFLAREEAVEAILRQVFDPYEGDDPQR